MFSFWKAARRKMLLEQPDDTQLAEYLECFAAGYNRGVVDVRKTIRRKVWTVLIAQIGKQLADNRSMLEAGCWLAGVHAGREDAVAGTANDAGRLIEQFSTAWEAGSIADYALECAPASMEIRKTLVALWLRREIPAINFHLRNADLNLLETSWGKAYNESAELVPFTSSPTQQTECRGE